VGCGMARSNRAKIRQGADGKRGRKPMADKLKGAAKTSHSAVRKVVRTKKALPKGGTRATGRAHDNATEGMALAKLPKAHWAMVNVAVVEWPDDVAWRDELAALVAKEQASLASKGKPILNDPADATRPDAKDLSRRMHEWPEESAVRDAVGSRTAAVAEALGCRVSASAVLSSMGAPKGVRRRRQTFHRDYDQSSVAEWRVVPGRGYPWTALWALDDWARITVLDDEGQEEAVVVLRTGQCVVFRGDVTHCGMAYDFHHLRAHFYLEPPDCEKSLRHSEVDGKNELALHEVETPKRYTKTHPSGPTARLDPPRVSVAQLKGLRRLP
jgi:hypothetical protein